jgi:hypothetical protein
VAAGKPSRNERLRNIVRGNPSRLLSNPKRATGGQFWKSHRMRAWPKFAAPTAIRYDNAILTVTCPRDFGPRIT